jgi:hypothetical protein
MRRGKLLNRPFAVVAAQALFFSFSLLLPATSLEYFL